MLRLMSSQKAGRVLADVSMAICIISLMALTIALMAIGFSTIAVEYRATAIALAGFTGGVVFAIVADWMVNRRG